MAHPYIGTFLLGLIISGYVEYLRRNHVKIYANATPFQAWLGRTLGDIIMIIVGIIAWRFGHWTVTGSF